MRTNVTPRRALQYAATDMDGGAATAIVRVGNIVGATVINH